MPANQRKQPQPCLHPGLLAALIASPPTWCQQVTAVTRGGGGCWGVQWRISSSGRPHRGPRLLLVLSSLACCCLPTRLHCRARCRACRGLAAWQGARGVGRGAEHPYPRLLPALPEPLVSAAVTPCEDAHPVFLPLQPLPIIALACRARAGGQAAVERGHNTNQQIAWLRAKIACRCPGCLALPILLRPSRCSSTPKKAYTCPPAHPAACWLDGRPHPSPATPHPSHATCNQLRPGQLRPPSRHTHLSPI